MKKETETLDFAGWNAQVAKILPAVEELPDGLKLRHDLSSGGVGIWSSSFMMKIGLEMVGPGERQPSVRMTFTARDADIGTAKLINASLVKTRTSQSFSATIADFEAMGSLAYIACLADDLYDQLRHFKVNLGDSTC